MKHMVKTTVFSVVIEVYGTALNAGLHAHIHGQIIDGLVPQEGGVRVVGQQDPGLGDIGLVTGFQEVGLLVQLDLIGLFVQLPGGIASALDLRQRIVVHNRPILILQEHVARGAVGLVRAGFHPCTALVLRIVTEQIHGPEPVCEEKPEGIFRNRSALFGLQLQLIVSLAAKGGQVTSVTVTKGASVQTDQILETVQ